MAVGTEKTLKEATEALIRMQGFDVSSLPRENELGMRLNLKDAVEPARALVDLFRRLSPAALEDFPDGVLNQVRDQANSVFQLFSQALKFDSAQENAPNFRTTLITGIRGAYPTAFQTLHPIIAYSLHRSADFQRLDAEARATLQTVEDKANEAAGRMQHHEKEAARVLEEIRKVAAEEGVSQQAAHFRAEAEAHEAAAALWERRTIRTAWLLGGFAVVSLFLHKLPLLEPQSTYDAVQLAISKVLIFGVITFVLVLFARNFLSHKHNAIVNKHRQNALMTHRALVEAATESGVRDAIMVQAASCIFTPQQTGYTAGHDGDSGSPKSVVEILSKSSVAAAKTSN